MLVCLSENCFSICRNREAEKKKSKESAIVATAQKSMEEARSILSAPVNPSDENEIITSLITVKVIINVHF